MEKENVEQAEAKLAAYERKNLENIVQNEARKVSLNSGISWHVTLLNALTALQLSLVRLQELWLPRRML